MVTLPVDSRPRLELHALPGLPLAAAGDDPAALIRQGLERAELTQLPGDVLVVTSKLISRCEDRFVDLSSVQVGERAQRLAREVALQPAVVELVLRESTGISRQARGALVVRHRLGFVAANGGLDLSNSRPPNAAPDSGPWALLLPEDPDASARELRQALTPRRDPRAAPAVVVSDSHGRPFRLGTVGSAIGCAGLTPLYDQRGRRDLHGAALVNTFTAVADQLAAAADLLAGQADESRPVILLRGLSLQDDGRGADALLRPPDTDLYA